MKIKSTSLEVEMKREIEIMDILRQPYISFRVLPVGNAHCRIFKIIDMI